MISIPYDCYVLFDYCFHWIVMLYLISVVNDYYVVSN